MRCGRNGGEDAQKQREGGGFGSRGKERGDRSGRAFINVGRPDLERRGSHFEAQANQDERESELEEIAGKIRGGHVCQDGCAGDAIDERDSVEEKRGGKGSEE